MIIAGSSQPELARAIASKLSTPLIISDSKKFADQELRVEIKGNVYGMDVTIVQSTSKPANDNLMELLLLADAAKRAGARRIVAAIPYFGYSRQDHIYANGPISASLIANMLEASGIDKVVTMDLHSKQVEGFFKIEVKNLEPLALFARLHEVVNNSVVVSPDVGGLNRAERFAQMLRVGLAVINKKRMLNGDCVMSNVMGDVVGKHCIIIDDIIDTGTTLCSAAKLLITRGALSVTAYVTHAVLSGSAIERLKAAPIAKLYVTDTIKNAELFGEIKVVKIADVFADALRCIHSR